MDCGLWRVSTLRLSLWLGRANTFDVYLRVINKSKRTCCVYHANDFNPGPTSAGVFYALKISISPEVVVLEVLFGHAVPVLSASTDALLKATFSEGHSATISLARLNTSPHTP